MYAKVYAIAALVGAVAAAESSAKPMSSSMHHGNGTAVTTTKVVTAYTTYCPKPTTICIGEKTYTVHKPTTLTITDCPCTIVETSHKGGQVTQRPVNPVPVPPGPAPTEGNVKPAPPAPGPNTEGQNKPTGPPAPGPAPTKPAVVVAGAEGRPVAYSLAMAAAGFVGYLAL